MIPTVIDHLNHEHLRVRYEAINCLGLLSYDFQDQFTNNFHETVVPALYETMEDPINRIKVNSCASLSLFFQNSNQNIGIYYCEKLLKRLLNLFKSDSIYIAVRATICMFYLAES